MIVMNELPCAFVPVEVKDNVRGDEATGEAAPEVGATVATIIVENGSP